MVGGDNPVNFWRIFSVVALDGKSKIRFDEWRVPAQYG